MADNELIEAVMVTAELTGTTLTKGAAKVLVQDLSEYPHAQVMAALHRFRKMETGRITLAGVLKHIDDGRPGAEEAWAMIPKDEDSTVVWTEEMREAWGKAAPLIQDGDKVAARMAFKEAYQEAVTRARASHVDTSWSASLGHDRHQRETVLIEAVRQQRLPVSRVLLMINVDQGHIPDDIKKLAASTGMIK